jgi:AcrR family transcriptional regulator
MNNAARRTYHSPLREARARETRERILAATADWLRRDAHGDFTLDAIAREAGIERRTVFRHFATREALLAAFWEWINHRISPRPLPATLEELVAAPREVFARFDDEEGVVRASLHTPAGRAMRMAVVPARRSAFRDALREATRGATAVERRRLEAVVHALYSAAAWETMRDYAGVTGDQAGVAASWAIGVLVDAVRRSSK